MGNLIADAMKKNMQESQKQMMEQQRSFMMKQRQVQLSMAFAGGEDLFQFYQAFYFLSAFLLTAAIIKKKTPLPLIPLVPLSFIYAYQYDMYRGNKLDRIRKEAARLIKEEPEKFYLPEGSLIMTLQEYKDALGIKKN